MTRWDDLFAPTTEPPRSLAAVPDITVGNAASSYAAAALRREAETVAAAPAGQRNDTLNRAAFRMGRHVGAGSIDTATVRDALTDAARSCGLPQAEIDLVLRDTDNGGLTQGTALPRHPPTPLTPPPAVTVLEVADLTANDNDAFWSARPLLNHVHEFARARRVSPWATLGVTLARVVTATPYFVVLPPIVGGLASLNLFVGLVGNSGAGKGAAEAVAAEAVDVGHLETHTTGSGEGIAHGYMRRTKSGPEWLDDHHAALFSVPEIDTLSALGSRQASTLMPELRRAWSGERLGFAYADPAKRLPVPAHEYRLSLVAGIQPGRAQALLDDADGGTPQRFLWLPAADPDAPDVAPPPPDPHRWRGVDTTPRSRFRSPTGKVVMEVAQVAAATIDQARLDRLRGAGEALDGHGLLCRLKAAAALALLEGRLEVTEDDWDLAGVLHRKSDATRAGVQRALAAASEQRNEARANAEAKRTVIVAEQVEDAAIRRVCKVIVRKLRREGGWTSAADVRRTVTSKDRGLVEEALARLLEVGQVAAEETSRDEAGHGGSGVRYRLSEEAS